MSDILLHTHMGLGDHLVLNGLVRKISLDNPNKKIFLCTRDSIHKNIELLYSDDDKIIPTNIAFYPKSNESYNLNDRSSPWIKSTEVYAYMNDLELVTVGYYKYFHSNPWDYNFYASCNIDYKVKYDFFHIPEQVMNKAEENYKNLIQPLIKNEEYIFLHDDPSRNYNINIDTKKKVLRNTDEVFKSLSIFDIIPVLKNASELRMMGSSLICLCDLLGIPNNKQSAYYYASLRGLGTFYGIEKWNLL